MKKSPRALVVLLLVLPGLAAGAAVRAAAMPAGAAARSGFAPPALPTAKTHLAAAGTAARKWQPDAILVHVRTDTAQPDGRAYGWLYVYFSPKTKAKTMFVVDEEGKFEQMPTFVPQSRPLVDFVDSDAAIGAAIKAGMKTNNFGMIMSLTKNERAEWSMSDREFEYTIDAANGTLLKKEKS